MANLTDKEALVLMQIDAKIEEYRKKKQEIAAKLLVKYPGGAEGVIALTEADDKGKLFVRVRVVDNLEEFKTGAPLWKSAAVNRFEVEIDRLKNKPKVETPTQSL